MGVVPLDNVRIVLVTPQHPGNIGAVARAMKTMGLMQLVLVRPNDFPSYEAERRAAGSADVLEHARIVEETKDAVGDCSLVVGSTARNRTYSHAVLDARPCGEKIVASARSGAQVAVLFGPERTGLSNQDLDLCNAQVTIPTGEALSSLNLASAVQLIAYEVLMAEREASPRDADPEAPVEGPESLPSQAELEFFFRKLERTLDARAFTREGRREATLAKLRRLVVRASPRRRELKMMHSLVRLMERDPDE